MTKRIYTPRKYLLSLRQNGDRGELKPSDIQKIIDGVNKETENQEYWRFSVKAALLGIVLVVILCILPNINWMPK